jgi:hypothetical protein
LEIPTVTRKAYQALLRRAAEAVEAELGDAPICTRCNATFGTMADTCPAALDNPCPGFQRVDAVRSRKLRELGAI